MGSTSRSQILPQDSVTTAQQPWSCDCSICSSQERKATDPTILMTSRSSVTNIILTNNSYQLDLIISYRESSLNSLQIADSNHLFIFLSGYRNAVQLRCCIISFSLHKTTHFDMSHLSQEIFLCTEMDSFVQIIPSKLSVTITPKHYKIRIKQPRANCALNLWCIVLQLQDFSRKTNCIKECLKSQSFPASFSRRA